MPVILDAKQITMRFGGLTAVDTVDMAIEQGEIRGLLGPNGAGKTTFFNIISGLYTPTEGKVLFHGKDITRLRSHQVAARGIGRTFQNILLFDDLSAHENVMIGCHHKLKGTLAESVLRLPRVRKDEKFCRQRAEEILEYVGLKDCMYTEAGSLPYGKKRLLEIGRALALDPTLLLLDEPAAGMNTGESVELISLIAKIKQSGVTILLVEHNMRVVMGISDVVTVLNYGKKIAEGTPNEVQHNPEVIEAYLGKGGADAV